MTNRVWRYENLFDTGVPADYLREYELVDVDDNRPNIRQPASIQSAKLCREENLDEYVIVFLAPGPGNSPPRPVKALSPETGLRVPRSVGGMAPPCEFTAPGPGLTVEIITDTEQFNAENNISGDSPPQMPEVEFGSRVVGNNGDTDPSGITFQWTMELSYEEGNYEDFADSVLTLTETIDGDTSWQPDFSQLPGDTPVGGHIEVTVNASQGQGQSSLSDTDVRDGYMIRGENPTEDEITTLVDNEYTDVGDAGAQIPRGIKGMIYQESANSGQHELSWDITRPMQFVPPASAGSLDEPGWPFVSGDNGWGLTQLTSMDHINRERVWNWAENVREGMDYFEQRYEEGENRIEDWHRLKEHDGYEVTTWTWDPNNPAGEYEMRTEQEIQEIQDAINEGTLTVGDFDEGMTRIDRLPRDCDDYVNNHGIAPGRNTEREENWLDGEPIHKVMNMQGYLLYNSGNNFPALFGELGIIRRLISPGPWRNLTGENDEPADNNLSTDNIGYWGEYEHERWE